MPYTAHDHQPSLGVKRECETGDWYENAVESDFLWQFDEFDFDRRASAVGIKRAVVCSSTNWPKFGPTAQMLKVF